MTTRSEATRAARPLDRKVRLIADQFEHNLGKLLHVRHAKSGKKYVLEFAVFEASLHDARPYVYVWPTTGRISRTKRCVWCYLDALEVDAHI